MTYSRYFVSEATGGPAACTWGMCYYPTAAQWNYDELRHVTLTLLATSGPIRHISMWGFNGIPPADTRVTSESFLALPANPTPGASAGADFPRTGTGGLSIDGFSVEYDADASSFPIEIRVDFDAAAGDPGYCQYGTELQPGQHKVLVISEAAVAAASLLVPGLAWLAVAWGALVGLSWTPGVICASPPPQMPEFTSADFIGSTGLPAPGSIAKVLQSWIATIWPLYCQCKPATGGGPTPIVYPPAAGDQNVDVPPPIAPIMCDTGDICTSLDTIMRQLTAITGQLALTRQDVQLVQRTNAPYGYVPGTLHSGLTDAGQFSVQGILAVAVQLTTLPGRLGEEAGDPVAYFDAGWVTLGTADGWRRSSVIRHNPQWLDAEPDDTLVGYSLTPGIVANILELVREP